MIEEIKRCACCGKRTVLFTCCGCGIPVCEACSHFEVAGGCSVYPLYYCPECAFDEKLNPNAGFKDKPKR